MNLLRECLYFWFVLNILGHLFGRGHEQGDFSLEFSFYCEQRNNAHLYGIPLLASRHGYDLKHIHNLYVEVI